MLEAIIQDELREAAAFQAEAQAKRDSWHEQRRSYVAEAAKILPRMEPWPKRPTGSYAWRIRPDPGTDEDGDPQD